MVVTLALLVGPLPHSFSAFIQLTTAIGGGVNSGLFRDEHRLRLSAGSTNLRATGGDVLIVKHHFSGHDADLYTTLLLIGLIVYFGTWSVVVVLFPKWRSNGSKASQ